MKNVITILIDSVFSECLGTQRTEESTTPFIDKMIKQGLYSPNVYSYGPYTDAATKGLYSGRPTLRDYGYYYGLNSSEYYHFRTFFENGYETYAFYYPYYLIGSKVRKYINHTVYTAGVQFPAIWTGKYNYYADKKLKVGLSWTENRILTDYTDLLFDCWLNFYEQLNINGDESGKIINNTKVTGQNGAEILMTEYKKYIGNKSEYIDELLTKGLGHPLAKLNDYVYDNAIDVKWIKTNIYDKYRKFFSELDSKEFWLNLKNNRFDISQCIKSKRYLLNVAICMFAGKYNKSASLKSEWQLVSSFQKKLECVYDLLENRKDNGKPFYISLHTEEPHNYVAHFSYDIKDSGLIDEEMEYLQPLLNNCGKQFKGNITYQLSLRYADLCVKRLVSWLSEHNLLDNTTIVLMADHGTSYSYYPVRSSVVNNFYKENYKTPFLIWNGNKSEQNGKEFDGLYSAEDVQPSICKSVGVKIPEEYHGYPLVDLQNGRDYVVTEYMGPGCPDMISRDVWMTARNKHYCIAYKNPINCNFDENHPVEVYDLIKDPYEKNNIVSGYPENSPEIEVLKMAIKNRFITIQNETDEFLKNIGSWNVLGGNEVK